MFEAIMILCIVNACLYMPMRGKTYAMLSPSLQKRAEKNYIRYMNSKKGKQTPNMSIDQYLPILQKQGLISLICGIVMVPIYILIVTMLYSQYF